MKPHLKPYLLDGPLMLAPERRAAMAIHMGAELVEADAFRDRGDAIRYLMAAPTGWSTVDIMILIDDARQWAMQAVVAAEIEDRT